MIIIVNEHEFKQWLGAIMQQVITWANVDQDLKRHLAPLSHNELTCKQLQISDDIIMSWSVL